MTSKDLLEDIDPAQAFENRLLARHKPMIEATERGDSEVQRFYDGTTVFLTGGSGFLGKQLVEKLLRATDVSKIFLLLRTKKGKSIQERLNEILKDPVYDMVRKQKPDFEQRIAPVAGDVAELRLGMSDEDWKTVTEQTDIIFHLAATTRFDEALRVATLINVRGTRETLLLGKECRHLRSFVHVSTAYSHAKDNLIKTNVLEDFYPSPIDPETMIRMVESVDDDRLNDITINLIKGWPNTYSFAKAIAEEMVRTMGDGLPICIVRPAIVIAAYREPNPGWVDLSCVYGASGIVLGPGLGFMHVIYASDETRIGLIPVDFVNNAIITAGWQTEKRWQDGNTDVKIYTVISSTRNRAIWGEFSKVFQQLQPECSTPAIIWYNCWLQTRNPVLFWIYTWLFHMIPAYVVDAVCFVIGKPRRFVKIYTKMYKMSVALSYFTINHWNFEDNNLEQLYNCLSPTDKEIFYFDIDKLDFKEYLITWSVGLRKYIVKDGLKGSRYAMKKRFVFRIIHYIITPIYFYILFRMLCFGFGILCMFFRLFF